MSAPAAPLGPRILGPKGRGILRDTVADYRAGRKLLPFVNVGRPLRNAGTLSLRFA